MNGKGHDASLRFSAHGWFVIAFHFLLLFFFTSVCFDGLNVVLPALSDAYGWDYATMLAFGTPAGFIAVAGQLFFGWLATKIGPKRIACYGLILAGFIYAFLYARATSLNMFLVSYALLSTVAPVMGYIGGAGLITAWFPKKKGVVLGITTIGCNMASAIIAIVLTVFISSLGVANGIGLFGIIMMAVGVVSIFLIKPSPAAVGEYPDNVDKATYESEYANIDSNDTGVYESDWTYGKLLKTKELWLCIIVPGIFNLCNIGLMSNLLVRNTSMGMPQNTAIACMTIAAVIGFAGSYFWGWMDTKIGIKTAMRCFALWYAAALVMNCLGEFSMIFVYISIFMIGVGIGGAANYNASLCTSVFGRKNFQKAFAIVYPGIALVQSCAFVVVAFSINVTGSQVGSYLFFACLEIIDIFIMHFLDENKYNDDIKAESSAG